MEYAAHFRNEPLQGMVAVGAVGPQSVRLWLRAPRPGPVRVRWWPEDQPNDTGELTVDIAEGNDSDNTWSVEVPGPGVFLEPRRRYRFGMVHLTDGHLLGEGRFETAPAGPASTPENFSVALFSCHQPFTETGRIGRTPRRMLRAMIRCLEERDAKFVLMMGDQMYADFPPSMSLFRRAYFRKVAPPGRTDIHQCPAAEVRQIYQERYRHFWNIPEWRELLANFPCYPTYDDHEVVDNWGSLPVHQRPEWQAIGRGAHQACFDYQTSRLFPPGKVPVSFHHTFAYGHTAVFIMDIRSERTAGEGGQLYSPRQEHDLRHFLAANGDRKLLLLVLSVPAIHLPRFLAQLMHRLPFSGEDFADRWSTGSHVRDRDRLLHLLHDHQRGHPGQHLVLLSGDIHIGCVVRLAWDDHGPGLYQLISSPITHQASWHIRLASKLIIKLNRRVETMDHSLGAAIRFLAGSGPRQRNPYGGLNLGLVEVTTPAPDADPEIRLALYGHRGEEPVCAFRSEPI